MTSLNIYIYLPHFTSLGLKPPEILTLYFPPSHDLHADFDNCYPRANFTSAQLSNIAFSSFPDCAQIGSLMFNWRIPVNSHATSKLPSATVPTPVTSPKPNLRPLASWSPSKNRLSPNEPTIIHPSHVSPISDSDLHGYVYFLQEKDPSVPRGYNQNSLVLVRPIP